MTAIKQIEDALKAIGVSKLIIRNLPERPNYNGSVLLIDDDEAERISEDLDDAAGNMREVMTHIAAQDAEIARLQKKLDHLVDLCDQSDSACYGTLSTSFVRNFVDALAKTPKGAA